MTKDNNQVQLLFESSWEVCNKIGGIYTVLSTKALSLSKMMGKSPIFIGPWLGDGKHPDFRHDARMFDCLEQKISLPFGINIKTGTWEIPGCPTVILVDFFGIYPHLNGFYAEMWEHYKVDSLHSYGDYDEGCAFAIASAMVMMATAEHLGVKPSKVIAHFNEWTTAMGLLWLQLNSPETATVFTTHATSIGRSICGNNKPLYDYFEGYHGDQMAAELNMESKHSLEKAAAHAADCFTTVSEVTARECRQLLDIAPQVVTPNGFEPGFVPVGRAYANLRAKGRKRILEVARMLTGKQISDDAFIVATSGRNEYRNKGLNVYIDAMRRVARSENLKRDIVALILVPGWVAGPSGQLLRNLEKSEYSPVDADYLTHRLNNEDVDLTVRHLAAASGEFAGSKVALIDIPCYLDGADGVIDIKYYDLLPALDMTVFASYYEPWGYTPLESIAFGVPTVSTDKAGFGRWVVENTPNTFAADGVHVVERTDSGYEKTVDEIAADVERLGGSARSTLGKYRRAAQRTAAMATWAEFITCYKDAFLTALRRRDERVGR